MMPHADEKRVLLGTISIARSVTSSIHTAARPNDWHASDDSDLANNDPRGNSMNFIPRHELISDVTR